MTVEPAIQKEIRRIAHLLYGDAGFGPNVAQWNRYRNPDAPTARPVITQSGGGYAGGRPEWSAILEACGLRYPPRIIAVAAGVNVERDERTHRPRQDDLPDGLPVIPCSDLAQYATQPVRRIWCPVSHRYRRIATAQTFLVR